MELQRGNSDLTTKKKKKKETEQINMQLDVETLTTMCRFVISDSLYVKRYDLSQLRKFLSVVDTQKMIKLSTEIADRLNFIRYGLEARLDKKFNTRETVLSYINQKFTKDIDIDLTVQIGKEEIEWVNVFVSDTLKYLFMYKDMDMMREMCNKFYQTSFSHRGDIVNEFEQMIDMFKNQFRTARAMDSVESEFSLQGENFRNIVTDTYNKLRSPSRRLYTGMQGVNMLTNGFESGRVYMLFGSTGVGKSVTLLNLMFQIKKYNKNYKAKDPTKRPCIVMLTQENSVTETVERLFDLVRNDGIPMNQYNSQEEAIEKFLESGELNVNDNDPIDMIVKYKPNHSINTDYLYNLCDELEDRGFEPICILQDHVKRIRSIDTEKELRIELGNIVNEFKVFATLRDIPVITNSHLNRDASKIIDNAALKNKIDITRELGKDNIGESLLMIDNLDMGIIINKEHDRDGNLYMVFKAIKTRYKTDIAYIAHPFEKDSTIKLVEDVGGVPLYKTELREHKGAYSPYGNMIQSNIYNSQDAVSKGIFESDESNIFASDNNIIDSDKMIPEFGDNNIPLNSDIPDYDKKEEVELEDPWLYYDDEEDTKSMVDDIASLLP